VGAGIEHGRNDSREIGVGRNRNDLRRWPEEQPRGAVVGPCDLVAPTLIFCEVLSAFASWRQK
jgi:hypothetical protein